MLNLFLKDHCVYHNLEKGPEFTAITGWLLFNALPYTRVGVWSDLIMQDKNSLLIGFHTGLAQMNIQ